ncbi:MAG: MFS family permease [Candidatus Omnitrophota bacterium]|jgi:MFS family permease
MKTLKFFTKHPYFFSFGMLQIFFSAPGQTFLVALFVKPIFDDLGVSQSLFAGVYSAATLAAALLLNPAGRLIDKYSTQRILKWITSLFCIGCLVLANTHNLTTLFIGFFLLRLIGQGVFGLTASTLLIKKFSLNRGKAMGLITLGFPLSEVIYPFVALWLLNQCGWRASYVIFGLITIAVMLPLQLFFIKRSGLVQGQFLPGELDVTSEHPRGNPEMRKRENVHSCKANEVLRDLKFYLILLCSCLPPMIVTGLFFHQETLFNHHGWAIKFAATGLAMYALCKAFGSIWIGSIVDKHGPLSTFIVLILMLALGTYLAGLGGSVYVIFLYFSIIGGALGFSSPVMNVVWPHFYGIDHMGSIKGLISTFRNGVTAFGPLPIAILIDQGVSIGAIFKWTSLGLFVLAFLPLIIYKLDH